MQNVWRKWDFFYSRRSLLLRFVFSLTAIVWQDMQVAFLIYLMLGNLRDVISWIIIIFSKHFTNSRGMTLIYLINNVRYYLRVILLIASSGAGEWVSEGHLFRSPM